jgi:hypothetical protein
MTADTNSVHAPNLFCVGKIELIDLLAGIHSTAEQEQDALLP